MAKKTKYDGAWENKDFRVVIKGNKYTSFYFGALYGKGTIKFDNDNVILTSTHAHRIFFIWVPFVEEVKGKYAFTNDGIVVSHIVGRYVDFNGIWKRCGIISV